MSVDRNQYQRLIYLAAEFLEIAGGLDWFQTLHRDFMRRFKRVFLHRLTEKDHGRTITETSVSLDRPETRS